jgi:uncharacterized protein YlbG (UPF0298 family)
MRIFGEVCYSTLTNAQATRAYGYIKYNIKKVVYEVIYPQLQGEQLRTAFTICKKEYTIQHIIT